jgi:hypothetical protein
MSIRASPARRVIEPPSSSPVPPWFQRRPIAEPRASATTRSPASRNRHELFAGPRLVESRENTRPGVTRPNFRMLLPIIDYRLSYSTVGCAVFYAKGSKGHSVSQ